MNKLSPIVLFVFKRPFHTNQVINALENNELASQSELFIYSDAPRSEEEKDKVREVRKIIRRISEFKKISIVERKTNWGLRRNIIDGISTVINQHGSVIVLEDDMVTSSFFLNFMNFALEYYREKKMVWHINGWVPPINFGNLSNFFFLRVMYCYGWATWSDRWKYFNCNPQKLVNVFSRKDKFHFNLEGTKNFWKQVKNNKKGKHETWAIFWYATIFKNGGLCLTPSQSYVKNIGFDGSGEHCDKDNNNLGDFELNRNKTFNFKDNITESKEAVGLIKEFYRSNKKSLFVRSINKLKRNAFFK